MVRMRPAVGVGVFVRNDGKILMQKRQNAHGAGTWALPGGHMEYNETPQQTASREAKEEANVTIKNIRVIGLTNDIMKEDKKHYITIFLEADYDTGTVRPNDDAVAETRWCDPENLPTPLFISLQNFLKNERLL